MYDPGFTVTGIKEIDRRLKKISSELARKTLKQGATAAAHHMRDAVKAEAKAMGVVDTGKLWKKITVRANPGEFARGKGRRGIVSRYVIHGTRKALGIPGDASGFYPFAQEFGSVRGIKARPFMRRAFKKNERTARQIMVDKIKGLLR